MLDERHVYMHPLVFFWYMLNDKHVDMYEWCEYIIIIRIRSYIRNFLSNISLEELDDLFMGEDSNSDNTFLSEETVSRI